MREKRFAPKKGEVYRHPANTGSLYRCMRSGGIIGPCNAILRNVNSKWTFVAYGCTLHPDGSLSWSHSFKGRFADTEEDVRELHYELYAEAVDDVGIKVKERILKQASEDPDIDTATMRRIVDAASFSWA